jgi:hypothetical protein
MDWFSKINKIDYFILFLQIEDLAVKNINSCYFILELKFNCLIKLISQLVFHLFQEQIIKFK